MKISPRDLAKELPLQFDLHAHKNTFKIVDRYRDNNTKVSEYYENIR
jgi:hypothetical protein